MKCAKPYVGRGGMYGCGQCLACRINKKRIWYHRLLLEASQYTDNAFVTLTYGYVQFTDIGLGDLVPQHLRDFLNRLRYYYEPLRFRFYAVGEYGDEGARPHYHVMLFGFPTCTQILLRRPGVPCSCSTCTLIRQAWKLGHIQVDRCEPDSMQTG